MERFTGKWYLQLFQNKDIMNSALYNTYHRLSFRSDRNFDRTAAALGIQAMRTKHVHYFSESQIFRCSTPIL